MGSSRIQFFCDDALMVLEERLETDMRNQKVFIALPKEWDSNETRISLTPDAVQSLTKHGHRVLVEEGAGHGSFFRDVQYSDAGAEITTDKKALWSSSVIFRICPPSPEEIALMQPGSFLFSALQLSRYSKACILALLHKKIRFAAFELLQDYTEQRILAKIIGELAGKAAVAYASELTAKLNGTFLGSLAGVRPCEVVVFGAGVVGSSATASAMALGAGIRVFDASINRLDRLRKELGYHTNTSILDPKEIAKAARRADIIIIAMPRDSNPYQNSIITEEMLPLLKRGCVVMDLGADTGLSVETMRETTLDKPYYIENGLIFCALPNITARVSRTASKAISNYFLSFLNDQYHFGDMEVRVRADPALQAAMALFCGKITHPDVARKHDLPYHDINLLLF